MTTSRSFQSWRRIAGAGQAALFLGLPFVSVGGESALRLDVPGGRLHAFGASFSIDEAFVVLAASLVAIAALLLVTLLYGRVWCGWSCPQTVLGDLTGPADPARRARAGRRGRAVALARVALVSVIFSAGTLWYFVPPAEFLRRLAGGTLGPVLGWSWAALGAALFLDLAFVRATFCSTVCPYARLQSVLFDRSTLVVAYDARRDADCVDCGACVRVCPTGIDIREGLQMACIACAACIDACELIMRRVERAPHLIGYFHGEPGGRPRPLRPGVLVLAAATAASLALLIGTVLGRAPLALAAQRDEAFAPRRAADGRTVNAFAVSVENRGRAPVAVELALRAEGGGEVSVRPERIALAPGERRLVHVVASARGLPPGRVPAELVAELRSGDAPPRPAATAAVSLVVPEER